MFMTVIYSFKSFVKVKCTIFSMTPFDGKIQIYKCLPTYSFWLSLTISEI